MDCDGAILKCGWMFGGCDRPKVSAMTLGDERSSSLGIRAYPLPWSPSHSEILSSSSFYHSQTSTRRNMSGSSWR